jgi:hypothetical protein
VFAEFGGCVHVWPVVSVVRRVRVRMKWARMAGMCRDISSMRGAVGGGRGAAYVAKRAGGSMARLQLPCPALRCEQADAPPPHPQVCAKYLHLLPTAALPRPAHLCLHLGQQLLGQELVAHVVGACST